MSGELSSAADSGADELAQSEYIAMLADGEGLCEEAATATRSRLPHRYKSRSRG